VTLRPLTAVSGCGPPPDVIGLAEWAAWRWAGPVSSFLRTASPSRGVRALPGPPPTLGSFAPATAGARGEAAGPPTVLRLPPATDLLPLVLDTIGEAGRSGRPGSVLVLVPSRGWAARLAARLVRRGVPVAADWTEAAAGWPVVVGSRAAAWSPVPCLAAALVLDAHDEAYREERSPTATAWEVVVERAARHGAPCTLVSPCPTVVQSASYTAGSPASADDGPRHHTGERAGERARERAGWPAVSVIDRRGADPRTGMLSEELVRLARGVVHDRHAPLVCVLHRTGRARLLACRACGAVARCATCGRPVAPSGAGSPEGDVLRCESCGAVRPIVCTGCGATRFKVLRSGVSKVRGELEALLGTPVAEVAGPSREGGDPLPATSVLIGTEAVLHRVRRAAAVVFLDFDQHLLAARFVAAEQALALLARAGRMVGGRGMVGSGPVLVQTRVPDHEVLLAAVHGDPAALTRHELELRRQLDLPPFAALALVSGPAAAGYCRDLSGADAPPAGLSVADLGGDRWLVRATDHRALCDALAAVPRPPGRLRVAVDPIDV